LHGVLSLGGVCNMMNELQERIANSISDYCQGINHLEFDLDALPQMTLDIIKEITDYNAKTSRLVFVDYSDGKWWGDESVSYDVTADVSYQDEGNTMKLVLRDLES